MAGSLKLAPAIVQKVFEGKASFDLLERTGFLRSAALV